MDEQQLRQVYEMVDNIPFSKPKRNITRDFADGLMMAQLIYYYRPKLVSLHNYPSASSTIKKVNNWNTLNNKVLKKLGIPISKNHIEDIVNSVPNAIESYLYTVFMKLQRPQQEIKITKQERAETPKKTTARIHPKQINQRQQQSFNRGNNESEQILQLVEEIESAYAQLCKLQDMSKLKDQVIRNLQKKVDKMIFS